MAMCTGVVDRSGAGRRGFRALAAVVAGVLLAAASAAGQELNGQIRAVLDRAKLGSSKVGICVMDADTGAVLAQVRSNTASLTTFMPASNMKLLTSGTALLVLGKDFEFRTRVYRAGTRLVIEGAGDPALADPELLERMHQGVGEFVDRLAKSVVDAAAPAGDGAGQHYSEIVVDDRIFDRDYVNDGWPPDQRLRWYCAEVSGLDFFANILRIYASPAEQEGLAPRLRWEPVAPGLEVVNRARTVKKSDSTTLGVGRDPANNVFTVKGSVRAALPVPETVDTHEPGLVLARMIAERLAVAGVGTGPAGQTMPACRLAGTDEDLGKPERVLVVVRTPLETVLERCNTDSHNLYAECLFKRVGNAVTGQPGSWVNGAAVVRMQVRDRIGADAAAGLLIADGSGLSRGNGVTPELLAGWLSMMARDPKVSDAFASSLATIGEGTLHSRFKDKKPLNEIRAKSGLIDGVRCLSGYVTHKPSGKRIAFSILVNDIPASIAGGKVKEFHEDVVEVVDKWLTSHAKAAAEAIGG